MAQIADAPELDDKVRAAQLKLLGDAKEAIQAAQEQAASAQQMRAEVEQLPSRVKALRAELKTDSRTPEARFRDGTPLSEVEQMLADIEAGLDQRQTELQTVNQAGAEHERRLRSLPGLIDRTRQELAGASDSAGGVGGEGSELQSEEEKLRQRAQRRMLEARVESLTAEQQLLTASSEVVSLQKELAEKRHKEAEAVAADWRAAVSEHRRAVAEREALAARELLESAHPELLEAAEQNAELAEERTGLARDLETLAASQTKVDEQLSATQAAFDDVRAKYDAAGATTALGFLMRGHQAQLPDSTKLMRQQRESEARLSEIQLRLLQLKDDRKAIPEFETHLDELHSQLQDDLAVEKRREIEASVESIRHDRREYLQSLITDYERQLAGTSNLNFSIGRLLSTRDEFAAFIGEHVLWIRSASPLTSRQEVAGIAGALAYMLSPSEMTKLADRVAATASEQPGEFAAIFVVFVLALSYGRRIRKQLMVAARSPSGNGSIRTAARAVVFSLLAALVWPLVVGLVAWRVARLEHASLWALELASALKSLAILLATAGVIRQLCREDGVGEQILGWRKHVTKTIRYSLGAAVLFGAPLACGVSFLEAHGDKAWIDSLGRVMFIGGMLLMAWLAHRTLDPATGILRAEEESSVPEVPGRIARLVRFVGIASPLILAGLAGAGYFYTAEELAGHVVQTLWLGTGTAILVSLARRWLATLVDGLERRLRRRSREESQLTGATANSEEPAAVAAVEELPTDETVDELSDEGHVEDAPHVTFTPLMPAASEETESRSLAIQRQLQRLINLSALVLVAVGSWSIWSGVLPAFGILDHVELGKTTVVVEETVTAPDGSVTVAETTEKQPITLRHALICLGLIAVTWIAARNLPGLLEAVLFQRLPLDSGGRYAATTLSRYAVTTVGWAWALNTVGVTWGSIQWLVAAMTVGLGFGLQEIFGNLVSGLILLFERPVRVGDLVTVGGTTGTVSKMRIRATTITDPDRRELVVPNKKFITDEFINWTLSDPITRVVFNIGVAYGSDTSLVHRLLLEIAEKHPLVLDEPAPSALMTGFGDSTLNFDLRIFIASRSSYVAVVHELNSAIEREFTAAGLEFAFPQRDLNIRSIEGLADLLPFRTQQPERRAA